MARQRRRRQLFQKSERVSSVQHLVTIRCKKCDREDAGAPILDALGERYAAVQATRLAGWTPYAFRGGQTRPVRTPAELAEGVILHRLRSGGRLKRDAQSAPFTRLLGSGRHGDWLDDAMSRHSLVSHRCCRPLPH